jgi:hypothetical protein
MPSNVSVVSDLKRLLSYGIWASDGQQLACSCDVDAVTSVRCDAIPRGNLEAVGSTCIIRKCATYGF